MPAIKLADPDREGHQQLERAASLPLLRPEPHRQRRARRTCSTSGSSVSKKHLHRWRGFSWPSSLGLHGAEVQLHAEEQDPEHVGDRREEVALQLAPDRRPGTSRIAGLLAVASSVNAAERRPRDCRRCSPQLVQHPLPFFTTRCARAASATGIRVVTVTPIRLQDWPSPSVPISIRSHSSPGSSSASWLRTTSRAHEPQAGRHGAARVLQAHHQRRRTCRRHDARPG